MAIPKVQVVFQGGGAKFAGLLAACEALQQLEAERKLEVTRVAGASAGAIAAVLYGARVSAVDVRSKLRILGDSHFASSFPELSFLTVAWRLARGRAVHDWSPIEKLLKEFIGTKTLQELDIPTLVSVTNLVTEKKQVLRSDMMAYAAALQSSGLPFVFRNVQELSKDTNKFVDGGLCENLPSAELLEANDASSYGVVLGVSFQQEPSQPAGNALKSYASSLLNIVINNSVERSIRSIGRDRVLTLKCTLGTLDFQKLCSAGLGDEAYTDARKQAHDWFARQAQRLSTSRMGTGLDSVEFHHDEASQLDDIRRRVNDLYERTRTPVTVARSALVVVSTSVDIELAADEVYYIFDIVADQPTRSFRTSVAVESGAVAQLQEWDVHEISPDGTLGARVRCLPIPCRDKGIDDRYYSVILFFDRDLKPRQLYRICRKDQIVDAFAKLRKVGNSDRLTNMNMRDTSIQKADLVLSTLRHVKIASAQLEGTAATPSPLDEAALRDYVLYVGNRPGYSVLGWRALDLKTGEKFGVALTRTT